MKVESSKNSYEISNMDSTPRVSIAIIPLIMIAAIIPLLIHSHIYKSNLMNYSWYHGDEEVVDFFLYYKQWTLVAIGIVMLLGICITLYRSKIRVHMKPIFIPLILYGFMAFISSLVSQYSSFAFLGLY